MTDINAHDDAPSQPGQAGRQGDRPTSARLTSWRLALAVAISLLPALGMAVAVLALGPRLGATMATHWPAAGAADSFGPTWPTFAGFAIGVAVATVVGIWMLLRRGDGRMARQAGSIAVLLSGILAFAWAVPAWATADAAVPDSAELGARMFAMLVAPVLAVAVFLLVPVNAIPEPHRRSIAATSLGDEERLAWVGTTGSVPFAIVGGIIGAGSLVLLVVFIANREAAAGIVGVIVGLASALAVLPLVRVRLTVDKRGVRLTSVFLGIPLMRIPLSDIDEISVETIDPLLWGGWGFRVGPGRRAYVTGRAQGIVVSRHGGASAAVTIAGAEEAASVGQALLAQVRRIRPA